jgi:homoserine kinase
MPILFHAALEAGALGVFLSGAGSAIVALTEGDAWPVANAMAHAAERDGTTGKPLVSAMRDRGAIVSVP